MPDQATKGTPFDVHINDFDPAKFARTGGLKLQETSLQNAGTPNKYLEHLLGREQSLTDLATKTIVFSPALISQGDIGIIGRNTVNIVQGAFGSHKSRLAELFGAFLLALEPTDPRFLGWKRASLERFCVCYIDSERNQSEELPHAIQQIKLKAGYQITDRPADFRFTSIKAVDRRSRFEAIEAFINHIREQTVLHLVCLIDVITDAVGDFNDSRESMRLLDFVGNLCDEHNATFLLVIHQNPGTDKARGHTGTEAVNKASTVIQIGIEKDANGDDSDLIKVRFLKLRRAKKPDPLFLQYCERTNGLVQASDELLKVFNLQRAIKAPIEDIVDYLTGLLADGPMAKGKVWAALCENFDTKEATIRKRLHAIMETAPEMYDFDGNPVRLADTQEGKAHYYKLVPIG
ncbi:MAG: hypothetical protein EAZ91_24855 [Cytophagales bacterium]|nr:MAG: hypothetical protein EAZ91_24855 [Cytophagales bacterium]